MSNVADAMALVSARRTNRPFTAKAFDEKAKRLRRAAVAELVNPEVPNDA